MNFIQTSHADPAVPHLPTATTIERPSPLTNVPCAKAVAP